MAVVQINEGVGSPVGVVVEDRVEADNLVTADPDFVAEAESLTDEREVGQLCQNAFELGVGVIRFAKNDGQALALAQHVERFEEKVGKATDEAVDAMTTQVQLVVDPESGLLAQAVKREMAGLAAVIDAAFDDGDKKSAISQIEKAVLDSARRVNAETQDAVRALLNPGIGDGPLAQLRESIVREVSAPVAGLADSIKQLEGTLATEAARRDERAIGTAKGRDYEEVVGEALCELGQAVGDVLEPTGDEPGVLGDAKRGDHVATITASTGEIARVVFECKDCQRLGLAKIRSELEGAMANREALVGVIVLSNDVIAPNGAPFQQIGERQYAVVFDKDHLDPLALRVAYHQARLEALRAVADGQSSDGDGLDVMTVMARLEEARGLLDNVTQVKSGLTKARGGIDKAEQTVLSMRTDLMRCLDECVDLVRLE